MVTNDVHVLILHSNHNNTTGKQKNAHMMICLVWILLCVSKEILIIFHHPKWTSETYEVNFFRYYISVYLMSTNGTKLIVGYY